MSTTIHSLTKQVTEWNYTSKKIRQDPFNEIELDVIITHKNGKSWIIPAFWAGGQKWKVRFSAPIPGAYTALTKCSDINDNELHQVEGKLSITTYTGNNPLYKHGPLKINISKRYFEHADGTPFFWLGDTWWMGLCSRLSWPENFKVLSKDRVQKGFSIIQIVAGLYPDMDSFDERGANEAGFPWDEGYSSINPAYFDKADMRIDWLVHSGLIPCILGSWGYYLFPLGINKMKQHWRYLIARWGAYPVVWTLAGETTMPYYLSKNKEIEREKLRNGWSEIAQYIKATDPYSHPLTAHPTDIGRDQIINDSLLDFDMLQTGHSSCNSIKNTLKTIEREYDRKPKMPVVVAEVNYEGILGANHAEIQRLAFWSSIISGANGFTYGANGVWQVNQHKKPFGDSPNGNNWGNTPWNDAYQLDGSTQLGLASKLLQKYKWWNFEFHPEWVSIQSSKDDITVPFVTGIPYQIRIIYFYGPKFIWSHRPLKLTYILYCYGLKSMKFYNTFNILNIEPNINYHAHFWNPRNAQRHEIGPVKTNSNNAWKIPIPPTFDDWIIILES